MPNQHNQLTKELFCIFYDRLETEVKKNLLLNYKKMNAIKSNKTVPEESSVK